MKAVIICLSMLVAQAVFAQSNCGPTSKFQRRLDLGNGMTEFYKPGIWTASHQTHYFNVYGTDGNAVCAYLGMKKEVSRAIAYGQPSVGESIVVLTAEGKWNISSFYQNETVITSIHCE